MDENLSASAQKVQDVLDQYNLSLDVLELPDSTRTAGEAARAVGCDVGQIVKSLIFKAKRSARPVLVLTSGANRVDEKKIESLIGEPLGKAGADFVKETSGFSIGGVPPVGHIQDIETFIDEDLLEYQQVWAAAGTSNAVFRISTQDLVTITHGRISPVKV